MPEDPGRASDTDSGNAAQMIDTLIQKISCLRSTRAASKLKLKNFGGSPTDSKHWWDDFARFCSLNGYNKEEQRDCLSFYLTGEALTWYRMLSNDKKSTIEILKKEFDARFAMTSYAQHSKERSLYKETQNLEQTGCEFAKLMVEKASGLEISEDKLIDIITGGLHPTIRPHILQKKPKSMSDLLKSPFMESVPHNYTLYTVDAVNAALKTLEDKVLQKMDPNLTDPSTKPLVERCDMGKSEQAQVNTASCHPSRVDRFQRHPIKQSSANPRLGLMRCQRCGFTNCRGSKNCGAYYKQCFKCNSPGHFKSMCPNRRIGSWKEPRHRKQGKLQTNGVQVSAVSNTSVQENYLPISIGGINTQALVDTGATISVMSNSFLEKIPSKLVSKKAPQFKSVTGVGGQVCDVKTQVELTFRVQNFNLTQSFHVLDGHHTVILGMDFLADQKAKLNFETGTITIHNQNFRLSPPSCRTSLVRTLSIIELLPNSVTQKYLLSYPVHQTMSLHSLNQQSCLLINSQMC
jgi:predicted aspartyl protease